MTYTPERVTPGADVRIERLSSAIGKVATIEEDITVVHLPWGGVAIPTRELPDGVEESSMIRLSQWGETAESLQAGRIVSEIRLVETDE